MWRQGWWTLNVETRMVDTECGDKDGPITKMSFSAGEGEVGLPVLVVELPRDVNGLSVASGATSLPCLQEGKYTRCKVSTCTHVHTYVGESICVCIFGYRVVVTDKRIQYVHTPTLQRLVTSSQSKVALKGIPVCISYVSIYIRTYIHMNVRSTIM